MRDQVWPHFARLVNFPANKLRSGNGETPTHHRFSWKRDSTNTFYGNSSIRVGKEKQKSGDGEGMS